MSKLLSCLYKKRWVTLWVLPRHSFWRITDHVHVCIKRLSLLGVLLWIVPFFTSLLWIVPCFYKLTLDCFKSLISGRYIVYDDLGTRISVFVGFSGAPDWDIDDGVQLPSPLKIHSILTSWLKPTNNCRTSRASVFYMSKLPLLVFSMRRFKNYNFGTVNYLEMFQRISRRIEKWVKWIDNCQMTN